jgi:hypothetical protein
MARFILENKVSVQGTTGEGIEIYPPPAFLR